MSFWKISASIYWSVEKNVPLFKPGDEPAFFIRATPPRDLRPALGEEVKQIRKILENYFKDKHSVEVLLPPDQEIILLNKIAYPDLGEEIIVEGQVIGHRFFDLQSLQWRFKPLYAGVFKMIEKGIGYYAIIDLEKISRNFIVHSSNIVKASLPQRKGEYLAFETKNGLYQGLGEKVAGRRFRVLKVWRKRRVFNIGKPNSWEVLIKANKEYLQNKEEEAVSFLRKILEKHKISRNRIFVSFSGGKDSLVSLLISLRTFGRIPILFNDTGLELPETVEYVEDIAKEYNLELIKAEAGDAFFRALKVFGPPARDYRWCCKIIKLAPIREAIRKRFGEGLVLSIVGQRRYESLARALSPRIWVNKWLPGVLAASPIHNWTALEVWAFIFLKKARPNPLYFKGFDRLGCWLCPACEIAEFKIVEKKYPELWNKWKYFLENWRLQHNFGEAWLRLHLWRWKKLPGDQKRLVSSEEYFKYQVKPKIVFKKSDNSLKIYVKDLPPLKNSRRIATLLPIISKTVSVSKEGLTFEWNSYHLSIDENWMLKPYLESQDLLKDLSAIILRANYCQECLLCVNACPINAIKIKNHRIQVDSKRCIQCKICNNVCPLPNFIEQVFK